MNESRFKFQVDGELEDLVPVFLENRETDMKRIIDFLLNRDYKSIARIGHTIYGNCGSYQFHYLGELGREIEHAAYESNLTEIKKLVDEFSSILANIEVSFYYS